MRAAPRTPRPPAPALLLAMLLAGLCTAPASAQAQAQDKPDCEVRDRSEELVLMICKSGSTPTQWRAAAQATCGEEGRRCNVWIWSNPADAPAKAPKTDAEIPKQHSAKAVAVWAHDSQTLLQIRKR